MQIEIVTIGDELLLGFTIDTNAAHLARELAAIGVQITRRTTVGDDAQAIAAAVRDGLDRAGAVITTLRVTVASKTEKIPLSHDDTKARAAQPQAARPVYWNENRALTDTPVYWGPDLKSGNTLPGPGIIEYPNTTIAVRPGQKLRIDGFGNAVLTLGADQ